MSDISDHQWSSLIINSVDDKGHLYLVSFHYTQIQGSIGILPFDFFWILAFVNGMSWI